MRLIQGLCTEKIDLWVGENFITLLPIICLHCFIILQGWLISIQRHLALSEGLTVLQVLFLDYNCRVRTLIKQLCRNQTHLTLVWGRFLALAAPFLTYYWRWFILEEPVRLFATCCRIYSQLTIAKLFHLRILFVYIVDDLLLLLEINAGWDRCGRLHLLWRYTSMQLTFCINVSFFDHDHVWLLFLFCLCLFSAWQGSRGISLRNLRLLSKNGFNFGRDLGDVFVDTWLWPTGLHILHSAFWSGCLFD